MKTLRLQLPRGPQVGSLCQHLQLCSSNSAEYRPGSDLWLYSQGSWLRHHRSHCRLSFGGHRARCGPMVPACEPACCRAWGTCSGKASSLEQAPEWASGSQLHRGCQMGSRLRPMVRKPQAWLLTRLPATLSPEGASKSHPRGKAGLFKLLWVGLTGC